MSVNVPIPQLNDPKLYPFLLELLRRSIDGTVVPCFISPNTSPPTLVIGGISARMNVPLSVVVEAAFDKRVTFWDHVLIQRSLNVSGDAVVSKMLRAGVLSGTFDNTTTDNTLPWMHLINPIHRATNSNWGTITLTNTNYPYNYARDVDTPANVGATIEWPLVLGAGTWTFELLMPTANTDRGIATVSLEGNGNIGTIDQYGAASDVISSKIITGIAVNVTGKKVLRLSVLSKNAASSAFAFRLMSVFMYRTG